MSNSIFSALILSVVFNFWDDTCFLRVYSEVVIPKEVAIFDICGMSIVCFGIIGLSLFLLIATSRSCVMGLLIWPAVLIIFCI